MKKSAITLLGLLSISVLSCENDDNSKCGKDKEEIELGNGETVCVDKIQAPIFVTP